VVHVDEEVDDGTKLTREEVLANLSNLASISEAARKGLLATDAVVRLQRDVELTAEDGNTSNAEARAAPASDEAAADTKADPPLRILPRPSVKSKTNGDQFPASNDNKAEADPAAGASDSKDSAAITANPAGADDASKAAAGNDDKAEANPAADSNKQEANAADSAANTADPAANTADPAADDSSEDASESAASSEDEASESDAASDDEREADPAADSDQEDATAADSAANTEDTAADATEPTAAIPGEDDKKNDLNIDLAAAHLARARTRTRQMYGPLARDAEDNGVTAAREATLSAQLSAVEQMQTPKSKTKEQLRNQKDTDATFDDSDIDTTATIPETTAPIAAEVELPLSLWPFARASNDRINEQKFHQWEVKATKQYYYKFPFGTGKANKKGSMLG